MTFAPLDAEERLLLGLIGRGAMEDRLRKLSLHVDWARFSSIVPADLEPYLDHRARFSFPSLSVPTDLRESWSRARHAAALRHIRRQVELRGILRALEARAIPAVVLKGMVLAHTAYPEPSTRPMMDVDLLVPPDRLGAARQVLLDLGFRVPERYAIRPSTGANAGDPAAFPLERPATRLLIELHTELESQEPPFRHDSEAIWKRSKLSLLGDVTARVLDSEDFLIHLAVHLSAHHRFAKGLLPLLDLALLVELREAEWDWASMADLAQRTRTSGWLYLTLKLARELLSASVPDDFFEMVPRPHRLADVESLALEQIWNAALEPEVPQLLLRWSAAPPGARWQELWRRAQPWRAEEIGTPRSPRRFAEGLVTGVRRFLYDLRSRVPRYLRLWRSGALRSGRVRRAIELWHRREHLASLMAEESVPSPRAQEPSTERRGNPPDRP
jgi:hypothetical protein